MSQHIERKEELLDAHHLPKITQKSGKTKAENIELEVSLY